jgi:hypothetical protein
MIRYRYIPIYYYLWAIGTRFQKHLRELPVVRCNLKPVRREHLTVVKNFRWQLLAVALLGVVVKEPVNELGVVLG